MSEPSVHSPAQDRSRAPVLPRTLVPPCFFNVPSTINDWRYECRRMAQLIIPNLFLGPMSVIRDESFMNENNIKLALSISSPQTWQILQKRYAGLPQYQALPVSGTADLVKTFPQAKQLIDNTISEGGSVLVYCETGNEMSAAVVVAYIMETSRWDLIRSIQYVQSQRFCVALDDYVKYQLRTYESLCVARQEVKETPAFSHNRPAVRRTIDDLYEDDDSTFTREGLAPFNDANSTDHEMTN